MLKTHINPQLIDRASLKAKYLSGASPMAVQKFDALNAHLPRLFVDAGHLIIVPSNTTLESTAEEAWQMREAQRISRALESDPHIVNITAGEYDLLQSVLGYSSLGIGSAASAWSTHLEDVRKTMEQIQQAYARHKSGAMDREGFFRQREVLLKQLNHQLQGAARLGTGLREGSSLRWMLGISTKRFMHKGEIRGYAERLERIAGMARHLRKGTYIGLALDMTVAGLEVKEACTLGREGQCQKAQFVEGGRLVGGIGGAALGGRIGSKLGPSLCRLFLGVTTKGAAGLTCAIIGGAAGGYGGGRASGEQGAMWGDMLYMGVDLWI
jgi:hypothetical protein